MMKWISENFKESVPWDKHLARWIWLYFRECKMVYKKSWLQLSPVWWFRWRPAQFRVAPRGADYEEPLSSVVECLGWGNDDKVLSGFPENPRRKVIAAGPWGRCRDPCICEASATSEEDPAVDRNPVLDGWTQEKSIFFCPNHDITLMVYIWFGHHWWWRLKSSRLSTVCSIVQLAQAYSIEILTHEHLQTDGHVCRTIATEFIAKALGQ